MSVPVLIAFAGVLVAAVVTGVLAGQCVRRPRTGLVAWTAAALGLTIALAAQGMGFARGFSPATFRAVQLFALALVPLWLGWGLAELVVANETARFGARLTAGALTVVASVILATDPLAPVPFGRSWPLAGPHFQPVSHYALDAVQAAAAVAAAACVAVGGARAGRGPRGRSALIAAAAVGLAMAMTAAMRLPLPARAVYPLLGLMAAALVWFGACELGEASRRGSPAARPGHAGRGGPGDDGRRQDDDWPAGACAPEGQYATYGRPPREPASRLYRGPGPAGTPADHGRPATVMRPVQRRPAPALRPARDFRDPAAAAVRAVQGPPPAAVRAAQGPAAAAVRPVRDFRGSPAAAAQPVRDFRGSPAAAAQPVHEAGPGPGAQAGPGGPPAVPAARPYGRILIFTLLDDRAADFDRLAEQTAEEVRTGEPDSLVYVIHLVPNAPMQRIFYEVYRDRAAFDRHESQPYTRRFVAERRSCVLATNVIELRLTYAKIAPLPGPPAPARAGAAARQLQGAPARRREGI